MRYQCHLRIGRYLGIGCLVLVRLHLTEILDKLNASPTSIDGDGLLPRLSAALHLGKVAEVAKAIDDLVVTHLGKYTLCLKSLPPHLGHLCQDFVAAPAHSEGTVIDLV